VRPYPRKYNAVKYHKSPHNVNTNLPNLTKLTLPKKSILAKSYTFVNGVSMTDYTLPAWKIKPLKKFHKMLKQKHEAYRINAIILLGSGWTPAQVAEVLLISEGSVRTYFKDFQAYGKEELIRRDYTGRESFLSEEQEQELSQHLEENLYQRSQDIQRYIAKKYKVEYSRSGLNELLHRLDFTYHKPKPVPGKVDIHLQQLFLRTYRRIRQTMDETDVMLFADAVHPTYNMVASYGWIKKGQEKTIATNSGRPRVNINGVVDIDSLQMTVDFSKSINGASTIRLFAKIDQLYPLTKKIHIVLDNARYDHSHEVRDWLARHKRIKYHYLPPYSPNLNLIERVWKFFHERVRNNRYYETFCDFQAACRSFFRKRKKGTEELRTRLTENFQKIIQPQF
jgi:transposase